jgi:hypothetical protein
MIPIGGHTTLSAAQSIIFSSHAKHLPATEQDHETSTHIDSIISSAPMLYFFYFLF